MDGVPQAVTETFEGWVRGIVFMVMGRLPVSLEFVRYMWSSRPRSTLAAEEWKEEISLLAIAHLEHDEADFGSDGFVTAWHGNPVPQPSFFLGDGPTRSTIPAEITIDTVERVHERITTRFSQSFNSVFGSSAVALPAPSPAPGPITRRRKSRPNLDVDAPMSPPRPAPSSSTALTNSRRQQVLALKDNLHDLERQIHEVEVADAVEKTPNGSEGGSCHGLVETRHQTNKQTTNSLRRKLVC